MPGELGLVGPPPAAKEAKPAAAPKAAAEPAAKPAEEAAAKPAEEPAAEGKPVPGELGIAPEGGAKKGVPAELGGAAPGKAKEEAKKDDGASKDAGDDDSKDSGWPLDKFPPGLYAPNGVPYPLKVAKELGPLNEFTGLLDNPDGTHSFPDGTIVDAPNTWVMTDDNVSDAYADELTMEEAE